MNSSPLLRRFLAPALRVAIGFALLFPVASAWVHVHRPHRPVDLNPMQVDPPLPFRDVSFKAADGVILSGWLMPCATPKPKGGIVVVHGVGANRLDVLPKAQFLVKAGYTCLLFDLRGHGTSQKAPCTYGWFEAQDVRAALDELAREVPGLPLGVFAQSMGAATTIFAAKRCPEVKAYVLDSPFATLWEMARENFRAIPDVMGIPLQYAISFWGSLFSGHDITRISPQEHVQSLGPRPVLFIHGEQDRWIPPEHSRRLHDRYAGPKALWMAPKAGHVQSHMMNPQEYEKRVLEHFARMGVGAD